jgi:hypothetical protein
MDIVRYELRMYAWPKARSRVGRIYDYDCTFQGGILVACGSVPRSKVHSSAIILVSQVSGVPVCVSLWIWLSHHQRNGQRITSYLRCSPGVINHFQLRSPVYHISNIIIIFLFDHLASRYSSAYGYI